MSLNLKDERITCPHCGHHIFVELDPSEGDQDYYEECPACCCEIHLNMPHRRIPTKNTTCCRRR